MGARLVGLRSNEVCAIIEMRGSSGFRFHDYGYWNSYSRVGSRLCFVNYEAVEHAGRQFQDLYEEYMVIDTSVKARKSKIIVNGAETLVDVDQNTSIRCCADCDAEDRNVARPITDYIFCTAMWSTGSDGNEGV